MKRLLFISILLIALTYAFACDMFGGIVSSYYNQNPYAYLTQSYAALALGDLRSTSSQNPDGCGFAFYHPSEICEPWDVHSDDPISITNEAYVTATMVIDPQYDFYTNTIIGHARDYSSGPLGGIHPFRWDSRMGDDKVYYFAQNGGCSNLEDCLGLYGFSTAWLTAAYNHCHPGETMPTEICDSELMFFLVMGMLERYQDLDTAINQAMYAITHDNLCVYTSLNFILTDGSTMYGFRKSDSSHHIYYVSNPNAYGEFYVSTRSSTHSGMSELSNDCLVKYEKSEPNTIIRSNFTATRYETTQFVEGLDWRCFPVMDNNTVQADNYFSGMTQQQQGYFTSILDQSDPEPYIWDYLDGLALERDEGYILSMSQDMDFDMKGTLTSTTYPISINNGENWIGYFWKGSTTPQVALVQIWQYLDSIESQDWFMWKENGQWYGMIQNGIELTMNYGEMYKINYTSTSRTFTYGFAPQPPSKKLPQSNLFTYTELPDYKGVVIDSLSGVEDIDEVALTKDGEVIGASKFTEYPILIRAYTDDVSDVGVEVLTKSKSAGNSTVRLANSQVYCNQVSNNVYRISNLDPGQNSSGSTPSEFFINSSIFPNPFTSSTTIRYTISKSSPVDVSIYNVKGQLVRKISNPSSKTGINNVIWDGKDTAGRTTAAGVYLCKITAGNKTLTSKVLRIK